MTQWTSALRGFVTLSQFRNDQMILSSYRRFRAASAPTALSSVLLRSLQRCHPPLQSLFWTQTQSSSPSKSSASPHALPWERPPPPLFRKWLFWLRVFSQPSSSLWTSSRSSPYAPLCRCLRSEIHLGPWPPPATPVLVPVRSTLHPFPDRDTLASAARERSFRLCFVFRQRSPDAAHWHQSKICFGSWHWQSRPVHDRDRSTSLRSSDQRTLPYHFPCRQPLRRPLSGGAFCHRGVIQDRPTSDHAFPSIRRSCQQLLTTASLRLLLPRPAAEQSLPGYFLA